MRIRCRGAARIHEGLFFFSFFFFEALAPDLENPRQTVVLLSVCMNCTPVQMGHSDTKCPAFLNRSCRLLSNAPRLYVGRVFSKHCRLLLGVGVKLVQTCPWPITSRDVPYSFRPAIVDFPYIERHRFTLNCLFRNLSCISLSNTKVLV